MAVGGSSQRWLPVALPRALTEDQIRGLFVAMRNGDPHAEEELIAKNLRLVAHVARRFLSSGEPIEDLVGYGTIGLIRAIRTYNPDKGWKFSTYATVCTQNAIRIYLRSQLKHQYVYLDTPIKDDDGDEDRTLLDTIEDGGDLASDVALLVDSERLHEAIGTLRQPDKRVIQLLYGIGTPPCTQSEVARRLRISQTTVSRIHRRALFHLRRFLVHGRGGDPM
jgi:RNA polymerase sporulation-specific sigma factor